MFIALMPLLIFALLGESWEITFFGRCLFVCLFVCLFFLFLVPLVKAEVWISLLCSVNIVDFCLSRLYQTEMLVYV